METDTSKFCHSCQSLKDIKLFNHNFRKDRNYYEISKNCSQCVLLIGQYKKDSSLTCFDYANFCILMGNAMCNFCHKIQDVEEFSIKYKNTGLLTKKCKTCHSKDCQNRYLKSDRFKTKYSILNGYKECKHCQIIKKTEEFATHDTAKTDILSFCLICQDRFSRERIFKKTLKYCKFCKKDKLLKDFCVEKRQLDGTSNECMVCHNKRSNQYQKDNPDIVRAYKKESHKIHRKKRQEKEKQRIKNNPTVAISCKIRSMIGHRLKERNVKKLNRTHEIIGCSFDFLRKRLFSLFTHNMTVTDFYNGNIHIGHIKPCCQFDLSDQKQLFECFNYNNLRPEWASDNLSKATEDKKLSIIPTLKEKLNLNLSVNNYNCEI